MPQKDLSCVLLNDLVQQYQLIVRSTPASSEERKQAGVVYSKIETYVKSHAKKTLSLNKLAPQTLHFLEVRGFKLRIKRAGGTKLTKNKKKRKGFRSWDFREI